MALLGEEQVSLTSGGKVRNTVTGVEHRRPLVRRELSVGPKGEGFVMAEVAVIRLQKSALQSSVSKHA